MAAVLGAATRQAQLHCASSSATAELLGVSLGLDLLPELEPPHERCALLCDSPVALVWIQEGDPCSLLVRAVRDKAARLAAMAETTQNTSWECKAVFTLLR